jgi:hypothetical protein
MFCRELRQRGRYRRHVAFDDGERCADLQHGAGIHDVLGRRPPVHVAAGFAELGGKLPHQPEDRIADILGFVLECITVEHDGRRGSGDRVGGILRDHAGAPLRHRKRDFRLDVALEQIVVGEHHPHLGRAEHVLEDVAVEDG